MTGPVRVCPSCSKTALLVIGKLVYPRDREWWSRMALVCWACNLVRRRGEDWRPIDLKRHERQWKTERRELEAA